MSHSLRHSLDWKSHPAVVFESDDWGACEYAPTRQEWERQKALTPTGEWQPYFDGRLESPDDMERLGAVLESVRDSRGHPAVFTAFTCLANPDFAKIAAGGGKNYHDLMVDEGFPSPWPGRDVVASWQKAVACGIWEPEFHARFHHTHAADWLALLRDPSPEGDRARGRFSRQIYCQDRHFPEYRAMTRAEIVSWISPAIEAFRRIFGRLPEAGVTSDATAEVEAVWAEHGMRIFCLRNFSIPGAPPIIYHTKPWNNQDASTPMGAWNPQTDVIYLSRNIFFEPAHDPEYSFDRTMDHIRQVWARNEPAVISTHRINYVHYRPEKEECGLRELRRVLEALVETPGIQFLSTREVAARYRHGD